ncbi:MAG TPA: N-acetylmuramoyl-L-alanine amidase [Actinomycetota bacterium]|nr:N-acetylmuramoyl-L-alanine amidase [Actinomycetota bacterium]
MAVEGFIGVGHGLTPKGVFDPGATSGNLVEHDVAVSVVDAYAATMKRAGVRVADESHSGGSHHDPNLVGSALKANQLGVKYADEVHFNAGGGTGPEVFVHPNSSRANKNACRRISAAIAQILDLPDRGLKFRDSEPRPRRNSFPQVVRPEGLEPPAF